MKASLKPALELTPEELAQLEASYEASPDFQEIHFAEPAAKPASSTPADDTDLESTIDIIDLEDDDFLELDAVQADVLLSTLLNGNPKKAS